MILCTKKPKVSLLVRFVAWLTYGKPVWLQAFDGDVYLTIAYTDVFNSTWCHVYWKTRIGHCILLPNGRIAQRSATTYIIQWKPA